LITRVAKRFTQLQPPETTAARRCDDLAKREGISLSY